MIPKSFQKQFSNQHQTWIDFAPNLAPFWEVFGGQDGAKFAPRCLQDAIFFSFFFWHRFLSIFIPTWPQLGPNLAPTWPQLGPQIHPKTHPRPILERKSEKNPTKMGPKLITFNQHEPKDPQSRPRTPPCTSFSLIFDRFLMDFWYYFHWFLLDFSLIFDPILIDAFMFLIGFWSPTCFIFSSITRNPNNSSKYFKNAACDNPLCRMSHRSPKARAGDDPPQEPSIDR